MGRACYVKLTVKEGQRGQRPERSEGESHFVIRGNSHPVERGKQVSGLGWECAWQGREGLRLGWRRLGGTVWEWAGGAQGASDTEASGGSEQGSDSKSDMVFKMPCCSGKEGFRELT